MTWKLWRDKLLIPDQHEPGVQRGFMDGHKGQKKNTGSEHHSKSSGGTKYYAVGYWGEGKVK